MLALNKLFCRQDLKGSIPPQDDILPQWASASTRTLVTFSDSDLSHITSYMVIRQLIADLQTVIG